LTKFILNDYIPVIDSMRTTVG